VKDIIRNNVNFGMKVIAKVKVSASDIMIL